MTSVAIQAQPYVPPPTGGTPILDEAAARTFRRLELADGDLDTAFDRLGAGVNAATFRQLAGEWGARPSPCLLGAMIAVEIDRANRQSLLRAERAYLDAERRWRIDVHPGQLALDGIEPGRHIPGDTITHRQELVLAVRIRAHNCCEDCGRSERGRRFDIHHLTYERYGHELPDDVLWICRGCHDRRHGLVDGHPPPPV
jgi:hypothetical protein